jgi:hypothetical protein
MYNATQFINPEDHNPNFLHHENFSLFYYLMLRDEVSHPYKTVDKLQFYVKIMN